MVAGMPRFFSPRLSSLDCNLHFFLVKSRGKRKSDSALVDLRFELRDRCDRSS